MDDGIRNGIRHVIGIVVFDGERFLLLHRVLNWNGWEFAKGAVEENEGHLEAIKRELFEETGIKKYELTTQIDEFEYFDEKRNVKSYIKNFLVHVSSNSKVSLNNEHLLDGKKVIEHDAFKWCFAKDAIDLLTHKNQKETMKKAINYLGLNIE
jgi:8-oxo-dGTP pyrophosphatase MutT (NUDIX family)